MLKPVYRYNYIPRPGYYKYRNVYALCVDIKVRIQRAQVFLCHHERVHEGQILIALFLEQFTPGR